MKDETGRWGEKIKKTRKEEALNGDFRGTHKRGVRA
jgi:hypothetical protein